MNNKHELIYEGKAKKIFSHDDKDKVLIEFKDDATAFNSLKKAQFKGKGKLNCLISARIFELLKKNNIPTHFLELKNEHIMIAQKIRVIPLEIVLRNTAYGSLCKQTTIEPGTTLAKPLLDIYLKNDELNDPLITKDRIALMNIVSSNELDSDSFSLFSKYTISSTISANASSFWSNLCFKLMISLCIVRSGYLTKVLLKAGQ